MVWSGGKGGRRAGPRQEAGVCWEGVWASGHKGRGTRLARVVHVVPWGMCDARVKGAGVLLVCIGCCWCEGALVGAPERAHGKKSPPQKRALGRGPGAGRRVW